jgi:mannosyltransferase OCH1-like enzyme
MIREILEKCIAVAIVCIATALNPIYGVIATIFAILYLQVKNQKQFEGLTSLLGGDEVIQTKQANQQDITTTYACAKTEKCEKTTKTGTEGSHMENTEQRIPKIIIQTWKTSAIPAKYRLLVDSVKYKNPTYEYKFFTDIDIEEFLKNNYPEYYRTYMNLPVKIQKIDFFRYVAVYHYGGFYLDLDMTALEPMDDLLTHECVFPIDEFIGPSMCHSKRYKNFCDNNMNFLLGQYAFAAEPKHPFIKLLIDNIHQNVNLYIKNYTPNSEHYVYLTTGPDFVSNLYMDYPNKSSIQILEYDKRQYFGKYARHNYFGTWK